MAVFRAKSYAPIPNSPFYYPETGALSSTTGPLILGAGIDIDYATGVISATGGGGGSTVQVTSPITNTGTASNPVIGIQLANSMQLGAVRVGSNINVSSGIISVNAATTLQAGIVRLNDTTTSSSDLEALTANQGRILQNQIDAISVSGSLILAATLDAATAQVVVVTPDGASAGFTVGANLPSPVPALSNYYVLVSAPGTYTPPSSSTSYAAVAGDWFLCNGSSWSYIPLGVAPAYATETSPGVIEIATAAEVQTGTDNTRAVTPAGLSNTFVKSCVLGSRGSLIGASAAGVPENVSLGNEGEILTVCNACTTGVTWTCLPASSDIPCSLLTARGQLVAASASDTPVALPVGTDGQVLVACSACVNGLTWSTSSASGGIPCSIFTDAQELLTSSAAGTPLALPVGGDGCILTVSGGAINWCPNTAIPCSLQTGKGQIISSSAAGTPVALTYPGLNGQFLISCTACPSGWTNAVYDPGPRSCFTAKGQILAGCGNNIYGALGVGGNGQVLTANSACALGVEWSGSGGLAFQNSLAAFNVGQGSASPVTLCTLDPGCYLVTSTGWWSSSGNPVAGFVQLKTWSSGNLQKCCGPAICWNSITTNGFLYLNSFSTTWALDVCSGDTVRLLVCNLCTSQVCFCINTSAIRV